MQLSTDAESHGAELLGLHRMQTEKRLIARNKRGIIGQLVRTSKRAAEIFDRRSSGTH